MVVQRRRGEVTLGLDEFGVTGRVKLVEPGDSGAAMGRFRRVRPGHVVLPSTKEPLSPGIDKSSFSWENAATPYDS
jgi:hypothetical protein